MNDISSYASPDPIAWCPGCGNFGILTAVRKALSGLGLKPEDVLMVSGIGQAGKLPHYLKANMFNGLHGRVLPVATAARVVNPRLTVIGVSGDGDAYAEGGNHFLHAMRRNVDLTYIVHNNQIYGLTTGQASPTTDEGMVTSSTPQGNTVSPERALAVAVATDCSFVARGFVTENDHLAGLIMAGIRNRGFSLIEVLQPCVTFNKLNTYAWYRERVYKLEERGHEPRNRAAAFVKALEWGKEIPIGVVYRGTERPVFEDQVGVGAARPLAGGRRDPGAIESLYEELR